MRYAAKTDRNQAEIVAALRQIGCSVTPTHMVSKGFPDICIGWRNKTFLAEIKDGLLPPSGRALTPAEQIWHDTWRGQVCIIDSIPQAIDFIRGQG